MSREERQDTQGLGSDADPDLWPMGQGSGQAQDDLRMLLRGISQPASCIGSRAGVGERETGEIDSMISRFSFRTANTAARVS